MKRRQDQINSRIMEVLSPVIETEMRDPRLQLLNLTRVKVNRDTSTAMIYVTSSDDKHSPKEITDALMRAKGFLRQIVAETLNLRRTPDLSFRYDRGVKERQRIEQLFEQIAKERLENPPILPPDEDVL
jgi:ribosome-binding factor A